MEALTEQIRGHNNEIGRAARWGSEVDTGPIQPFEGLLASYDPRTHVTDDLFTSKIAFAVLLNFPLTTLADRIKDGANYSRRQWAEVRLASEFDARVPSELEGVASGADAAAEAYIAGYNLWMHHILGEDGKRLFPSGKRLISHWNLRDELKANYADKDGLSKQRTIAKVMERIATQSIPKAVIDNPHLDWDPFTNKVTVAQEIEADAPKDRATSPIRTSPIRGSSTSSRTFARRGRSMRTRRSRRRTSSAHSSMPRCRRLAYARCSSRFSRRPRARRSRKRSRPSSVARSSRTTCGSRSRPRRRRRPSSMR